MKNHNSIFILSGICLLLFLLLTFTLVKTSNERKRNSDLKQVLNYNKYIIKNNELKIKHLELTNDSLVNSINNRNLKIKNIKVIKPKIVKIYEKQINSIDTMPTDSSIKLLTNFLSTEFNY